MYFCNPDEYFSDSYQAPVHFLNHPLKMPAPIDTSFLDDLESFDRPDEIPNMFDEDAEAFLERLFSDSPASEVVFRRVGPLTLAPRRAMSEPHRYELFVSSSVPDSELGVGGFVTIPCGYTMALPPNMIAYVSGVPTLETMGIATTPYFVHSSDHEKELQITLFNASDRPISIHPDMVIGQFVLMSFEASVVVSVV